MEDCTYAHEEKHIEDALNSFPDICKNSNGTFKPDGTEILYTSIYERNFYEYRAYTVTLNCLRNKLKNMDPCNDCYRYITKAIKFYEEIRDEYKQEKNI